MTRIFFDMDGVLAEYRQVPVEEYLRKGYFAELAPRAEALQALAGLAQDPRYEVHTLSAVFAESEETAAEPAAETVPVPDTLLVTVFGQEIRENNEKLQSYLANMIEQAGAEDEETLHISRMFAMSYVLEEIMLNRKAAEGAPVDEDALDPAGVGAPRNRRHHIAGLVEDGEPHSQPAFGAADVAGVAAALRKPTNNIVRQPALVDHAHERGCQPDVRDVLGDVAGHAAMHLDNTAGIPARRDVLPVRMPLHVDERGAYDDDSHDSQPLAVAWL